MVRPRQESVNYRGPYFFEGPGCPGGSFRDGIELTLRNWRLFKALADQLGPRFAG